MRLLIPFYRAILAFIIVAVIGQRAAAQLVSGEVFLQGAYVESGLASNGAFGSVNAAPAGYHTRTSGSPGSGRLGFVADPNKDGWTVGSPAFFGDYFLGPIMGECQEGWRVQIGSSVYTAWRGRVGSAGPSGLTTTSGITGSNTGYISTGGTKTGTWDGTIGNLKIRQTTTIDTSQLYIVVNVAFKNTGSTTISNVYYERDVNPENENGVDPSGMFYYTDNKVEFKLPNVQNKTLVSATGRTYGAYMGMGTKDCRAKGFISNDFNPTSTPADAYAGTAPYTYAVTTVASADDAIGIVYQLGNIAAGDSTSLSFSYVLKAADLDSAFAQIQHGFVHNGTSYQSKDTIRVCAGTTDLSISNPGDYSWTWLPATGLSTTTGSVVTINVDTATITYCAIGTSPSSGCGTVKDTIYLTVKSAQPAGPAVLTPVTYCLGTTASALSATGTGLKWYTAASGGTGSATAPTPSTAASGSTTYYVSQTSAAGCESGRSAIVVTVNATPAAPVVSSPVTYCTGAAASTLSATGSGLKWYTSPSGGTGSTTAPTPSTAASGSTTYYVSQTSASGCESGRSAITVNVNATPAAPGVSSPITYCTGATASVLSATGTGLLWYTSATGGTGNTTAPTPSTGSSGSTTYYVTQTSAAGCESGRSPIVVNVIALPAKPVVTTPVTYCQNATSSSLSATGTGLLWYTTSTGGTGTATAPIPSTAAAGTTTYYVSQTASSSGCSSLRASIDVVVNATPDSPLVTTPVVYCLNDAAAVLTATGSSLKWYTAATGGTGSGTAPTPVTSSAGSTSYYVSQTSALGCESKRSRIGVTVNALPAKPAVTTPIAYCQNAVSAALTATGTSLVWYTVSSGGTGTTTAPVPSTTTVGTTTYYVTQTASGTGCTSPRAAIDVVINMLPSSPAVSTPVQLCQGVSAAALTATGTSLLWYTVASGGTGSSTAPVPPVLTLGATSYYVSQTNVVGCEGPRAEIVAIVNPIPAAPVVVTPIDLCIGVTPAALSAAGTNLKWYAAASGGTASTTATVPDVSATGSYSYYVSQASPVGCESPRAMINTTVHPSPVVTISTPYAPDFVYCPGFTVTLKANAPTAVHYQWQKAEVDIPGAINDSVVAGSNGDYSIRTTDVYGCQATKTVFVFKDTLPEPDLAPTNVQICPGVNIMLYCSPATSGYTYLWSKDGTSMGAAAAKLPVSETGLYEVKVTDYYGCTSATNVASVSTYPAVVKPVITRYDKTLRLGGSYASQQWYRNNVAIPGATGNTYTLSFDGMYYAQVYDANGCTTMSDTIHVEALGIPELNGHTSQLRLYPNPTQGKVTIETDLGKITISVTDMTGRDVLRCQDVKEIDLGGVADGMYLITVTDGNGMPIVIEKIHKLSN